MIHEIWKIKFDHVSFSYPNSDHPAIKNLSMLINPGDKIAIVGENGSGKTTLTKLLMGVYKPSGGSIAINDIEMQNLEKSSYLKKISLISRDFVRYSLTLRENVAMSDLTQLHNDPAMKRALHDADFNMDEALLTPLGLDAILGKEFDGIELSGGQWQKIAIARGIFRGSELIIMDEPTSAIDPIAETEILKAFLEIAKDKTAILVSHRTGLCTMVDKIAVMKEGALIEYGTHEALIREDKEYAKMFNAQMQWYI